MDLFAATALAIIQGVSAWIPVSSKTQVILAGNALFGMTFQAALAFALALHAGDLLAALFKYKTEYVTAAKETVLSIKKITEFNAVESVQESRFLVLSVFASAVVALPAYLLVRKGFSGLSGEPFLFLIGLGLLAMAGITALTKAKPAIQNLNLKTTLVTGAAQGLAVIPGISRSGITQSALLLQGIPQERAMRLSFLMSAPLIAAALVAYFAVEGFGSLSLIPVALGIVVSFLVSLFTMDALTNLARKIPAAAFLAALGGLCLIPFVLKMALGVGG